VGRVRAEGSLPLADLAQFVSQYAASLRSDEAVVDLLVAPCVVDSAGFECEFAVRAVTIDDARSIALDVGDRAIASGFDGLLNLAESGWTPFVKDPGPADGGA